MSNYVKFDATDIQTIIALVDDIPPEDRDSQEEIVYNKAIQISNLQNSSFDKQRPELYRDQQTGRLTIQYGEKISEPVGYNGIAKIGNLFAVTDYYKDVFPSNVLLRFFHANPKDREAFEAARAELKRIRR